MPAKRAFRTTESYLEEDKTRSMVRKFLTDRGLTEIRVQRRSYGKTVSQTIHAALPSGERIVARVKLCWRPRDGKRRAAQFSAAQLMARVKNSDWEGSIQSKINTQRADGITHMLIVQREGPRFRYAALLPLDTILPIWRLQRDTSQRLIKSGALGRRKKNPATNGSSPTIWLADDRAPEVAMHLWAYPRVIPLTGPVLDQTSSDERVTDDTYDDLPGLDVTLLGSDGASRRQVTRSGVPRNAKVRAVVLARAHGRCEREDCGESRGFPGFLDVHHILGVAKSDRVYNCVALCPNCHREAHFAPEHEAINRSLLRAVRARSRPASPDSRRSYRDAAR